MQAQPAPPAQAQPAHLAQALPAVPALGCRGRKGPGTKAMDAIRGRTSGPGACGGRAGRIPTAGLAHFGDLSRGGWVGSCVLARRLWSRVQDLVHLLLHFSYVAGCTQRSIFFFIAPLVPTHRTAFLQ